MAWLESGLELLSDGEVGLFIYTNGLNFKINADGSGETGWWVFNPERPFDRVFVFLQGEDEETNAIFSSRCGEIEGPNENGRYRLKLSGVQSKGQTRVNWKVFAAAGQNPIRFLSKS